MSDWRTWCENTARCEREGLRVRRALWSTLLHYDLMRVVILCGTAWRDCSMDKFVRDIHINVECNVGYWIHLLEQSTTSYFPLADDIPIVGGRSYKLRVHYAGHAIIFTHLIRLVPRSFDLHTSPYFAVGSSFVPGCVSSPDLRRSLFVSSRMPASRHFWQIIWRYISIQTSYVCIFVFLTVDWDCFYLSFFSYLSTRLTFVYFVYFIASFSWCTISCQ